MRVREVLRDPSILKCFDFFNDTKDTLSYLEDVGTTEVHAVGMELLRLEKEWSFRHGWLPLVDSPRLSDFWRP